MCNQDIGPQKNPFLEGASRKLIRVGSLGYFLTCARKYNILFNENKTMSRQHIFA